MIEVKAGMSYVFIQDNDGSMVRIYHEDVEELIQKLRESVKSCESNRENYSANS